MSEFSPAKYIIGGILLLILPLIVVGMLLALDNVYKGTTLTYAYGLSIAVVFLVIGPLVAMVLFRKILRAHIGRAWSMFGGLLLFIAVLFLVAGSFFAYITERAVFDVLGASRGVELGE